MITINLETLRNGKYRVTGKHNGSTILFLDGIESEIKGMFEDVAKVTAPHHMVNGVITGGLVKLNKEMKEALQA